MSKRCEWVRPRIARFADGALSEDERLALQEHLETCLECRRILESLRQLDRLARDASDAEGAESEGDAREFLGRLHGRFDLEAAERLRRAEVQADFRSGEQTRMSAEDVAAAPLEGKIVRKRALRLGVLLPRATMWRWMTLTGAAAAAAIIVVVLVREPQAPHLAVEEASRSHRAEKLSAEPKKELVGVDLPPPADGVASQVTALPDRGAGREPIGRELAEEARAPAEPTEVLTEAAEVPTEETRAVDADASGAGERSAGAQATRGQVPDLAVEEAIETEDVAVEHWNVRQTIRGEDGSRGAAPEAAPGAAEIAGLARAWESLQAELREKRREKQREERRAKSLETARDGVRADAPASMAAASGDSRARAVMTFEPKGSDAELLPDEVSPLWKRLSAVEDRLEQLDGDGELGVLPAEGTSEWADADLPASWELWLALGDAWYSLRDGDRATAQKALAAYERALLAHDESSGEPEKIAHAHSRIEELKEILGEGR
jgi:hypothetical protein